MSKDILSFDENFSRGSNSSHRIHDMTYIMQNESLKGWFFIVLCDLLTSDTSGFLSFIKLDEQVALT